MLRFCDSFDAATASGDLTKKWSSVGTGWVWVSGAGEFGAGAGYNDGTNGSGNALQTVAGVLAGQGIISLGVYVKFSANPASQLTFAQFRNTTGGVVSIVQLTTAGKVNYNGTVSTITVTDNKFHWIETLFVSTGASTLYVDGVLQGSTGGTGTIAVDNFQLLSIAGVQMTVDDIILYDGVAGGMTNASYPVGARQITCVRPASDNTVNFSVLSSGATHFNLVNEVAPDGDTSYCQDGTSGDQDLFNMSALGYIPTNINTVMVNLYLENPTGGTINSQAVCKNGATTTVGTSKTTPATYQTLQTAFPTDPNTGAAWTPAGLGTALFGYKNP